MAIHLLTLYVDHKIGDTVYLITDPEQSPRIIYAYKVYPTNLVLYFTSLGTVTSEHYGLELSSEMNVLAKR